ncbi:MAG: methyltransferase domain-containing protein [Thermoleophilia bacterium]
MEELRDPSLQLLAELAQPAAQDTVLDYASAAGMAAFTVAPDVRSVEAADELPDLLEEGGRLAAELGLVNVAFSLVDLSALPHEADSFSLVVCVDALHLLPDPVAALVEISRVLSAGGRLVLVDPVVQAVTDKAFNDLARLREPAHRRHYLADEVEELVARAGLCARRRETLRRTIDLDYWLQTAAVPAAKAQLIRNRFRELPVEVQAGLDVVFADRLVSFSYDVLGLRLERP